MQPSLPFGPPSLASSSVASFGAASPSAPVLSARAPVFVRHPRARRYVLRVMADGTVRVTIPRWGSKREAAAFAGRERSWIEKEQRRVADERQRLDRGALDRGELDRGENVWRREPAGEELRALREQARRELPARLMELATAHGLTVARVTIRNQRSRWGSCSRSAHICLNWRLVRMPAWVRDYVLVHELMHLKRMDHSPAFWKLVAAACPEYKKARAWLRAQSVC
jgi:predicted metal-dependent hydrolase